jgi:hypothetical protein
MFRVTRKKLLSAVAVVAVLGIAAGAYAYFTSTGSGTGTASVGTTQAVTIHATVGGALYPGTSQPVTFTIDNPSSGTQRVGTITLTKITPDATHSTCSTAITGEKPDFTMAAVTVNKTFAPGSGQAVTPTGTLTMNDTGVSQDACQGATLTLQLTSN